MAKTTFKNSAKDITIEECLKTHKNGMAVYFEDGKDVTFETEA